jgi:CRP-like cAMP-binding protein
LLSLLTETTLQEGQLLFREGDLSNGMHFIVEGRVDVQVTGGEAESLPVATLGPGEIVGEMGVIDGCVRTASAVAGTRVRTCFLKASTWLELAAEGDRLAIWLLDVTTGTLARRIQALTERVAAARADPAQLRKLQPREGEGVRRGWAWLGLGWRS